MIGKPAINIAPKIVGSTCSKNPALLLPDETVGTVGVRSATVAFVGALVSAPAFVGLNVVTSDGTSLSIVDGFMVSAPDGVRVVLGVIVVDDTVVGGVVVVTPPTGALVLLPVVNVVMK